VKVLAVIQARLGSSRLPRKCITDICGKPLIAHVVERVQAIEGISSVVGAVPVDDNELVDVFRELGVDTVMGSQKDVLSRFSLAAHAYRPDIILRITGDCPVLDPSAANGVIQLMEENNECQFASNDTLISGWPDGTDIEAFRVSLLNKVASSADCTASDREHVTPAMKRLCNGGKLLQRQHDHWSNLKLSVDTLDDLKRIRIILHTRSYFRSLLPVDVRFSLAETVRSGVAARII
jgi:spore coat polysaccharide biosynthesis protein SpsF